MWYFIADNQVVSPPMDTKPEVLPVGFALAEGEELEPAEAYFDGTAVVAKPPQPSSLHYWNESSWELPPLPVPMPLQNWDGLVEDLRRSMPWAKVYEGAGRTLKANKAFTLLYGTLTTTHHLSDFATAIADVRDGLRGIAGIGDFTAEELEWLRSRLEIHGFNPDDFDLQPIP
ncbi:hypothetical protein IQ268_08805 [Oculatella sp. LEGE 06141]|uniref:hypothetical protein n=1 Tax=Oculatella sp. LEGE 06141 TaxID=1828648 RepID=UPI0018821CB1|nr:hypothetical protein [Oculatella sp. LEGE 06141]MBE9178657.1 hypothetical protein [Oculatella sp. LEGE 06141]